MKMNRQTFFCIILLVPTLAFASPKEIFNFGKGVVWGFDFVDSNTLVISQRSGELSLLDLTTQKLEQLSAPTVFSKGQGGLLDVKAVTLNNKTFFYVTYSKALESRASTTALARAEYIKGKPLQWQELFVAKTDSKSPIHYGSRLLFVGEHIYMTVGDRGKKTWAQDLDMHNGKVLRLNLDGSPARGNPFSGQKGALPEIWSIGHRNPQGISYDPDTNSIYVAEFGPRGGDEINRVEKGKNYGWPVITHGVNYSGTTIGPSHKEGLEQPLVYWSPSVSPSGLAFMSDDSGKSLLMACLSGQKLLKISIENDKAVKQEAMFDEPRSRIRHVVVSPKQQVYFSTDKGKIYRF